ncbi:PAS domain S-box protein [Chitinimonas sp. PSY-7]|uniref:PAS domain S-box protein n=1 Tax=Chitinimonas sp. PSY-7 TaxID=3459088 RepID=UPI0040402A2A
MSPRLRLTVLVFLVGCGLTLGGVCWYAESATKQQINRFKRVASQQLIRQELALRRALLSLDAMEALFANTSLPTAAQFNQLSQMLIHTSGVDSFVVAEPVSIQDRTEFERRWRTIYPKFSIWFRGPSSQFLRLRSTEWQDFLPVIYGEKSARARFGLGLDLSSEIELIPDSILKHPGSRAVSSPFLLESGESAVLALTWQRYGDQRRLLGVVLVPARILAAHATSLHWQDVAFDISQVEKTVPLSLGTADRKIMPLAVRKVAFGGRTWQLESHLTVPSRWLDQQQMLAILAGMGLAALSAMLMWRTRLGKREPSVDVVALQNELLEWQAKANSACRNGMRLQTLLNTTGEAVILADKEGRIELFNAAAERLFGYGATEVHGLDVSMLLADAHRNQYETRLGDNLAELTAQGQTYTLVAQKRNGVVFPAELLLNAFDVGEMRYFVGVIRDVSDRQRAERLLFESEQKYRAILDAAHIGIYLLQNGQLRYVNPAFAAYFGRNPTDLMDQTLVGLVAPTWRASLVSVLDPEQSSGRPTEIVMQRPDGNCFYALISARPTSLNNQPGIAGSLMDISERKEAEEARLRAEIRNAAILGAIPDLMLQLDKEGRIMDCRAQLGGSEFGLGPDCIGQYYTLGLPNAMAMPLQDALKHGPVSQQHSFEYSLLVKTGLRQFEARLTAASDGEWLLMVRDITERKQIEAELIRHRDHLAEMVRERTAELDTLFAASPLPAVFLKQGRILAVNQAFVSLFGYQQEQLIGQLLLDSDEQWGGALVTDGQPLHEGKVVRREVHYHAADGSSVLCEAFGKAIDPAQPDAGSIWVYQDIGERRAAEKAMQRAKELAEAASRAKSEFLANMSHELRTPMHAVLSFAELGERRANHQPDDKLGHYFGRIRNSGQRLLQILNDLLDLSKLEAGKMSYDMKPISIGPLLREIAEEFATLARSRAISIELQEEPNLPLVNGDALRLGQVLRNLVGNALKFSPEGGRITLRASVADGALHFFVEDQGIGIPADELDVIFDKFVQSSKTKTGAGGTGLGLAICHEIVSAHSGRISASNLREGGARFHVCLPI